MKIDYTICIEATDDPDFFGFFSPDLPGYTGTGVSLPDAIVNALEGIDEYLEFRREHGAEIPPPNPLAVIRMVAADEPSLARP